MPEPTRTFRATTRLRDSEAKKRFSHAHGFAARSVDTCALTLALCEPHARAGTSEDHEEAIEAVDASVEFGFVYLMRFAGHNKIERTNAIGRREREIAIQLPEKVRTVHS